MTKQDRRTDQPAERPATFGQLLRHREFRSMWLAEFQSVAGDQLARVALAVLVFDRTRSAGLTAAVFALTYVPDLVAGPLLGGLADRYPRRRVMVAADITRACLVALLAVPGTPLMVLAGLVVMVQLLAAPFSSAQTATLRVALHGDQLTLALATRQTTVQVGQLLGFGLGGALVAFLGVHTALALNAATFAVSAVLVQLGVRSRPAPAREAGDPDSHLGRVLAGARVVWSDPVLRTIALMAWLALFMVVPEGLATVYVAEIGGGPAAIGLLLAAHPAGFVVGALAVGRLLSLPRQQRIMAMLAIGAMLPLLGFAGHPPVPLAMALLAVSGACGAYQAAALATFVKLVPDRWTGQALGWVGSVLIGVQGAGIVAGGVLAEVLRSAAEAIVAAAAVGLLAALWVAREWRRHRPPAEPTPPITPGESGDSPGEVSGRSNDPGPGEVSGRGDGNS